MGGPRSGTRKSRAPPRGCQVGVKHLPWLSPPQGRATSHPVHDCLVKITSKTTAATECFKIYFHQRGLSCPPPTCSLHVVIGWCHAMCPNDSQAGAAGLLLFLRPSGQEDRLSQRRVVCFGRDARRQQYLHGCCWLSPDLCFCCSH